MLEEKITPAMPKIPGSPWKRRVVPIVVLVAGIGMTALLVGKMRERKAFVSPEVAGYRYRCTLSTDWKLTHDSQTRSTLRPQSFSFTAPPSPIRAWIASHLPGKPPSPKRRTYEEPTLVLETEKVTAQYTSIRSQGGYPELNLWGAGRILTDRHLQIDKCPATLTRFEIPFLPGKPVHGTCLCVFSPDHGYTYLIGSLAEPSKSDRVDREMEAIAASFHVEMADDQAASKR